MFEAEFSESRKQAMIEYFPRTYKLFESILRDDLKEQEDDKDDNRQNDN